MDRQKLSMLIREAEVQCRLALLAYDELQSRIGELPQEPGVAARVDSLAFMRAQTFLSHAASVSRLFWPGKGGRKRGTTDLRLRHELAGSDTSALKKRGPRDYLEHFDERLEKWCQSNTLPGQYGDVLDMWIAPFSALGGPHGGFDTSNWFRILDPTTMEFYFRNQDLMLDAVALDPLAAELRSIKERAGAWLKAH